MAGVFTFISSLTGKATCIQITIIVLLSLGTGQAAPQSGEDLWNNPCSNRPVRHIRSTAEQELNFFIRTLNREFFKQLKSLYNTNITHIKSNCPKLRRLIKSVEKASNLTMAHQRFYESMIELAVYLDHLKKMPIKTENQINLSRRLDIYERTKDTLKLTICEFNDTIMKEYNNPNIFQKKPPSITTKCLPKETDYSGIQMLDMQFFRKLKKFFKQGRTILRKKKRISGRKMRGSRRRTKS